MWGAQESNARQSVRRALSRLRADYPAALIALAMCGGLFPYVIVLQVLDAQQSATVPVSVILLACAGSLLTGVTLLHALAPLRRILGVVEQGHSDLLGNPADPGWRLARAVEAMDERITQLRADITCLTAPAMIERRRLLAEINRDISIAPSPIVLGVLRFADFEQLASFDPREAARALDAFVERARRAVDSRFLLAEIGVDTLAVWFRAVSAEEGAAALRALGYVLAQDLSTGSAPLRPRLKVGEAVYPTHGEDADELLARAVASLTERESAKTRPPPSSTIQMQARTRFTIEQDIAAAIQRQELSLLFQPVVDLAERRLVGAEALLRWNHPKLGPIPPAQFIPVIEQSSAIEEIGAWTLTTACRQASKWSQEGLGDLRIAVNLSARQLADPSLSDAVVRTLERCRLSPHQLELELTETAAMQDAERTLALFRKLHALGVGLAIDDFGSGYSSLSYLKALPFTKLKIDREFVSAIDQDPTSVAICRSLVELSRGLGISVLAEGVETRAEVETLRSLGCTMFQGFYFGRPMSASAFSAYVSGAEWQALLASPVHRERAELQRKLTQ